MGALVSDCFTIDFPGGRMLYITPWHRDGLTGASALATGWRPYSWTRDFYYAEKFASFKSAQAFAMSMMSHNDWYVRAHYVHPPAPIGVA